MPLRQPKRKGQAWPEIIAEELGAELRPRLCPQRHDARPEHGSLSAATISTYDLLARSKAETYGSAARVGHTYGAGWEYHMLEGS
ncbi:hypothetical protein DFH09DRAFT_1348016 [Mycena vulgaris]|nr:hypothetical protein DFH09DRAFT_1348016 [Mycena vulgaris]